MSGSNAAVCTSGEILLKSENLTEIKNWHTVIDNNLMEISGLKLVFFGSLAPLILFLCHHHSWGMWVESHQSSKYADPESLQNANVYLWV